LLIGIKGKFNPPSDKLCISSIHSEKQKKYGAKPKWFYEQIEIMFPDESYLDLFSPVKFNRLWTVYKNQTTPEEAN